MFLIHNKTGMFLIHNKTFISNIMGWEKVGLVGKSRFAVVHMENSTIIN